MNPLDPAELSAYLDGELPAERMREIERIAASDPTVRAELESLAKADAAWQASARTAAFRPAMNLSSIQERRTISGGVIAFILLLLVAQIVLRVFNALAVGLVLEFLALVVVLAGVAFLAMAIPSGLQRDQR